jgi:acyl-CoA reductase-like NAD-dependent aldehyde dehydrogenase
VAEAETGLDRGRLSGELARTTFQLRLFADVVDDGAYLEPVIDHPDPQWVPTPRPDVRRILVPRGPVAVFGASNFPLAFSVAGGDTASALAAGCPVIVKAHPAHPATSELVGRCLVDAVGRSGLPAGTFGLLHGREQHVGEQLVRAPAVVAVAFTGSLRGGRALFDLAARRPAPIPVFAEMGSLNPVVITVRALQERAEEIAEGFVQSMLMGSGQFCTKPGVAFVPAGEEGDRFVKAVAGHVAANPPGCLLGAWVRDGLAARVEGTTGIPDVEVVAHAEATSTGVVAPASVFQVELGTLEAHADVLLEEHFGPVALVVRYAGADELRRGVELLPGSLTATLHATGADIGGLVDIQRRLVRRAGRIIWNGWPTGVAVTYAMQHGGPYPATTDAGHTSVGTTAVRRFLRPVAFQNAPADALPAELRDGNPKGIPRLVDGQPEG